jgi:hypothetical protein
VSPGWEGCKWGQRSLGGHQEGLLGGEDCSPVLRFGRNWAESAEGYFCCDDFSDLVSSVLPLCGLKAALCLLGISQD